MPYQLNLNEILRRFVLLALNNSPILINYSLVDVFDRLLNRKEIKKSAANIPIVM